MWRAITTVLLCAGTALAQKVDLSGLDKLAQKARESVNVNLGQNELGLASSFLGSSAKEQKTRTFLSNVTGVYVRVFEFDAAAQYSPADLEAVRKQVQGKLWSKIADVKSGKEAVEVYVHNAGKPDQGMLVIAAEEKELAVVNVLGVADLANLGVLGGLAKIPNIESSFGKKDE